MSRAKGNRTRYKCIAFYEEKGWEVATVENNSKFVKIKDLFGLFDLIAVKDKEIMLIQVKTNKPAPQADFKDWARFHGSKHVRVIVWTWYDYKGARIQEYLPDGTITETDLRE